MGITVSYFPNTMKDNSLNQNEVKGLIAPLLFQKLRNYESKYQYQYSVEHVNFEETKKKSQDLDQS